MLTTLCAIAALAGTLQGEPKQQTWTMQQYQLIVLKTGKGLNEVPADQASAMQAAHLKFLEGLWKADKSVAIGPFVGNKGDERGLIVLDVRKPEEVKAILDEEPYIKGGYMTYDRYTWLCAKEVFGKGEKFMDLQPMKFAMLTRPEGVAALPQETAEKYQAEHMKNINAMYEAGACWTAGPILDGGALRGIFIFKNLKDEGIQKLVAADPLFANKRLEMKLFPWFTSKGTIKEPPKK